VTISARRSQLGEQSIRGQTGRSPRGTPVAGYNIAWEKSILTVKSTQSEFGILFEIGNSSSDTKPEEGPRRKMRAVEVCFARGHRLFRGRTGPSGCLTLGGGTRKEREHHLTMDQTYVQTANHFFEKCTSSKKKRKKFTLCERRKRYWTLSVKKKVRVSKRGCPQRRRLHGRRRLRFAWARTEGCKRLPSGRRATNRQKRTGFIGERRMCGGNNGQVLSKNGHKGRLRQDQSSNRRPTTHVVRNVLSCHAN